ncbi:MAG: glycosyltransferase family 4 protein [Candidatus Omnitrophica bacterium]|nr:glycosyltransferase family 4 protein [Candidatus Omnitrophota bacterium]MBU1853436.1 glycosyltransferase family 4 protein [Candidatus Omnitrophota bacterium]
MKVIFVTREGHGLSGARVRCYNFARVLRRYGITTEVFSFADNLGAKYGEKEFEMSYLEKLRYNIKAFKLLLREEKDAVFFIQRLNYHTIAPFMVSLLKKNRFIFDCDDWNIREDPIYYFNLFPSSKMEFLTRKITRYANICTVASVFLKDYLCRFNKKIYYLPTGVDTAIFNPNDSHNNSSKISFSWIGTLYHKEMQENIRFILACFSELADRYRNIFLNLAGEGVYFREISRYVATLRYRDRIMINNWIPPDKIPDHLSHIDIGLLPLIQHTKFNKSKSPTKLFEYMAMGKPTVSSNIGEAAHIIHNGENGFLAGTKEEFVARMEELINDPILCRSIGDSARKSVEEKYSLNVLSRRLYDILKTI